jgi:hypothetical protein
MDTQGTMEKSIPLQLAPPSSYNVLKFSPEKKKPEGETFGYDAFGVQPFAGFEEDDLLTAPYKQ